MKYIYFLVYILKDTKDTIYYIYSLGYFLFHGVNSDKYL